MGAINILGLAANDPVPGVYTQLLFAQGQSGGSTSTYPAILLGNKTSAGSAGVDGYVYGPDTPTQLNTEEDAVSLFGSGSELHRMYKLFVKLNKSTSVYAAPILESSGSAATFTVAFTLSSGSNPAAPGSVRTYVGWDIIVDTGYTVTDTTSTLATNVAANVNAQVNSPFNALASTNSVTFTAKQKGPRGNWLKAFCQVIGFGTNVVSSKPATSFFTGGTTADSNINVLTYLNNLNQRYYYIVSAAEDATQFGAVSDQIDLQASPIPGIRQRCFAGSVDSISNVNAIALGVNAARSELVWYKNSEMTPAELAAHAAADYSLVEAGPLTAEQLNFDGFGNNPATSALWLVPASLDGGSPSRNELKSALNNGVTPIKTEKAGRTSLVSRITTCSTINGVFDYRIRDSHKVTVCDYFADDLSQLTVERFSQKTIEDDPPKGSALPPPGKGVITPNKYKQLIVSQLNVYSNNNLLQGVDATKAGLVVQREVNPSTRMTTRIALQPSDVCHQIGIAIDQV